LEPLNLECGGGRPMKSAKEKNGFLLDRVRLSRKSWDRERKEWHTQSAWGARRSAEKEKYMCFVVSPFWGKGKDSKRGVDKQNTLGPGCIHIKGAKREKRRCKGLINTGPRRKGIGSSGILTGAQNGMTKNNDGLIWGPTRQGALANFSA